MIAIDDPGLPGLARLDSEALRRITGAKTVSLMRLRYRAGSRAIVHLDTEAGEGSLWFFHGDKAKRLAHRNKTTSRYDTQTAALFEVFPNDHRMPQIRAFLDHYARLAPDLIGARPVGRPELLRYRPGLSCTFRCQRSGAPPAYVKLINDDSPVRLAQMNRMLVEDLRDGPVSVAPMIAINPDHSAIAYAAAPGRPLDAELVASGNIQAVQQSIHALRHSWRLRVTPFRHLTPQALAARGAESVALTLVTVPEAARAVRRIINRVEARTPRLAARPIHADMKLEHLFIDSGHTTLIDTESISLGPPDYDMAQLYGRLWQAELEGQLPRALVEGATREVRKEAGNTFDWCLDIVALRLVKFYAQRPAPNAARRIEAILERLA